MSYYSRGMNTCASNHEDIAYIGGECPLCHALELVKARDEQISNLEAACAAADEELSRCDDRCRLEKRLTPH